MCCVAPGHLPGDTSSTISAGDDKQRPCSFVFRVPFPSPPTPQPLRKKILSTPPGAFLIHCRGSIVVLLGTTFLANVSIQSDSSGSPTCRPNLVIRPNVLTGGSTYTFRLSATDSVSLATGRPASTRLKSKLGRASCCVPCCNEDTHRSCPLPRLFAHERKRCFPLCHTHPQPFNQAAVGSTALKE